MTPGAIDVTGIRRRWQFWRKTAEYRRREGLKAPFWPWLKWVLLP